MPAIAAQARAGADLKRLYFNSLELITARTLLLAALASCAMSSVATESAHADGKTYPGSMCRRFTGPELTREPLKASAMTNPSTTVGMRVDCPIVKDVVASGLDHVRVLVVDNHSKQNVCCRSRYS